ncbi:hypothetical protein GCM10010306_013460 [Streptomyces umbrinus]|nr:hypothetical protein GCM10010306_013460 [Streptomyces umbrinus]
MKETSKESRISGKFLPVNSADSRHGGYTPLEPFRRDCPGLCLWGTGQGRNHHSPTYGLPDTRGAVIGAVGGGRADDGVLSAAGGGEGKSAIAASSEADTALR